MTIESTDGSIESISAVTLATQSMAKSVEFYRSLGFELASGGPQTEFTTFRVGGQYLNIIATLDEPGRWGAWGSPAIVEACSIRRSYVRDTKKV